MSASTSVARGSFEPPSVGAVRSVARRRRIRVLAIVTGAVVMLGVLAMSLGEYVIAPPDLLRTLMGNGTRIETYVVFDVRLPRLVMGLLVGACLGVAGALLQTLLRNPLASPDLLGISGGSGAAAVFGLLVLGWSGAALAMIAFAGGIIVAAFLLAAGARRGDGGYRLVLAGVGVAFLCSALTGFLMVRGKLELAQNALIWLTGTLASTPWWNVAVVAGVSVICLPFIIGAARMLPLTQLGPATAVSLGVRPSSVRIMTVVTAVLLTAVTCAFVGPISFIALCAPAIARPLLGHGAVAIGTSAAVGAGLLIGADLIAQYALAGYTLPAGVVTGAIGAVFLLWMLATSKGRHL